MFPAMAAENPWFGVRDGDDRARFLYDRHYSARSIRRKVRIPKIAGPGETMLLMTPECNALWVWRKFIDRSGQRGVNCAVFRNEGMRLSSELVRAAVTLAWRRWPGQRLYTYVKPSAVRSTNPGWCFICAGWRACGWTKGGLRILEMLPAT